LLLTSHYHRYFHSHCSRYQLNMQQTMETDFPVT
jgi:hypothetical protein